MLNQVLEGLESTPGLKDFQSLIHVLFCPVLSRTNILYSLSFILCKFNAFNLFVLSQWFMNVVVVFVCSVWIRVNIPTSLSLKVWPITISSKNAQFIWHNITSSENTLQRVVACKTQLYWAHLKPPLINTAYLPSYSQDLTPYLILLSLSLYSLMNWFLKKRLKDN